MTTSFYKSIYNLVSGYTNGNQMPTTLSSKLRTSISSTPAKSSQSSPSHNRSGKKNIEPKDVYDDIEGANASKGARSLSSRQVSGYKASVQNATPNKRLSTANGVTPTSSVRKRGRPSLKDVAANRESSEEPDLDIRRSARGRKPTQKSASTEHDYRDGSLSGDNDARKRSVKRKSLRETELIDEDNNADSPARSKRGRRPSAKATLIESDRKVNAAKDNSAHKSSALRKKDQDNEISAESEPESTPLQVKRKRGRPRKVVEHTSQLNERRVPSKRPLEEIEPANSVKRRKENINPATPSKGGKHSKQTLDIDMDLDDELSFDTPTKKKRGRPASTKKEPTENVPIEEASSSEDPIGITANDKLIMPPPSKEPAREGEAAATRCLANIVLEKLSGKRSIPLVHLEEEYAKVHSLVEATVVAGEGNSMVLIGARGTGKSTLVNTVLSDLAKTQKEYFHVIRLNGFIQTDDKLALREIWRQLGREMEIDEEAGKSYADTLTMLLALLSHPDEIVGERLGQVAKSVIFIMDEFDLFATHARQTLLYNLLDIAQSRKAPIAVIGLTTKFDVQESLEKRVKSRFSHRYVYVSLAKSMVAFQDICIAALSVEPRELSFEEKASLTREMAGDQRRGKKTKSFDPVSEWNNSIKVCWHEKTLCIVN
jgi:origin recognition complex subunit 4